MECSVARWRRDRQQHWISSEHCSLTTCEERGERGERGNKRGEGEKKGGTRERGEEEVGEGEEGKTNNTFCKKIIIITALL